MNIENRFKAPKGYEHSFINGLIEKLNTGEIPKGSEMRRQIISDLSCFGLIETSKEASLKDMLEEPLYPEVYEQLGMGEVVEALQEDAEHIEKLMEEYREAHEADEAKRNEENSRYLDEPNEGLEEGLKRKRQARGRARGILDMIRYCKSLKKEQILKDLGGEYKDTSVNTEVLKSTGDILSSWGVF